jgi:hypothetical protein
MRARIAAIAALAALVFGTTALPGQTAPPAAPAAPAWSPQLWLEDLAVVEEALRTKYANLEWLLTERGFDLDGLFVRARAALAGARGDADAAAVFNRLVQRISDGHVGISWPRPAAPPRAAGPAAPPLTRESFCRARGYDPAAPGFAPALRGFTPIESGDVFHAGTFDVGGKRVGIVRIGVFHPQGSLALCTEAVAALAIPLDRPCDEACEDGLLTRAYRGLTAALDDRLRRLRAAGAEVLLVDITGNGGGSEWAEAAARMFSRRPLVSARLGFVRGEHWARTWTRLRDRLRGFAETASPADRDRLLGWAREADAARAEAERRCPPTDGACPWLGRAGYATGLVAGLPAGRFDGKEWGPWVFSPAQYPYRDGAWDGPVVLLVDQETWSAAEQFAAVLQDNRIALVVGARTGGSGCGHTWGGTPTRLPHSGATLNLPDCARFRADGSNEVRGVIPDLLLPWRANDGAAFRARLLEAALPEAIARAREMHRAAR